MLKKFSDLNLKHQRVLIREDFNVPIEEGKITSSKRIDAALPTLEQALRQQACVMVMSHLDRPKEGENDERFSLKPVADYLGSCLQQPVRFIKNWLDQPLTITPGELVLFENVRFLIGEKSNDPLLAKKMASLCDIFVMDAFATAHRKEASTYGVAEYAPTCCAGPLLVKELDALKHLMKNPQHPLLAIIGGAKVSTKLHVLESILTEADQLILGGGIANTFLAAQGYFIGKSLYEPELIDTAKQLLKLAEKKGIEIPLPQDVIVANEFSSKAKPRLCSINDIKADEMILDVGPVTAKKFVKIIHEAKTLLWNGPVGVFEWKAFESGTKAIAEAIADSKAYSIAGGGDTLAAIEKFKVEKEISYISTGGGAFLEFVEGKKLPALEILELRSESNL